jgi:hypothetical protein
MAVGVLVASFIWYLNSFYPQQYVFQQFTLFEIMFSSSTLNLMSFKSASSFLFQYFISFDLIK